jgi:type IV secretory pathway TrbL component
MHDIGNNINNAFYFVVEKIIALQGFFIDQAKGIGRIVLLIAILSAALNYALTGTGLKENVLKILKATLFFLIVISAYPRIIGWITSYTYNLAAGSVGDSVKSYFENKTRLIERNIVVSQSERIQVNPGQYGGYGRANPMSPNGPLYIQKTNYQTFTANYYSQYDNRGLFSNITTTKSVNVKGTRVDYTTVAPASVVQVLLLLASDCIDFSDNVDKKFPDISEFSRVLKGLICAFFLILTGVFALLEYLVCFMEFMLVASVGIILFPLSIWEGSKFMSEKFIGAIVGFFIKLLFCNIAIFLLLYGFISMFYIIDLQKFKGEPGQIAFIIFTCLLFFYICKSAPGIAQSLLTGSPSLSASGAISAVGGAVAAVGATAGFAKSAGNIAAKTAGAVAGGGARAVGSAAGSLIEAAAAGNAVKSLGGSGGQQFGAFMSSIGSDIGDSIKSGALGLTRSISGGKNGGSSGGGGTNPHSWKQDYLNSRDQDGNHQTLTQHLDKRKQEGSDRGMNYILNDI